MVERHQRRGTTDRSPLILIVILVYAAFLVTAMASIMLFFPKASLPGSLRLPTFGQAEAVRPAQPAEQPPRTGATPAFGRIAAAVVSRFSALEWPELRWPEVGGWFRGVAASAREWLLGLEYPDLTRLRRRQASESVEPSATTPVQVAAAPVTAQQPVPPTAAAESAGSTGPERAAAEPRSPSTAYGAPRSAPGAPAQAGPDVDSLRRSYEARLLAAEGQRARDVAAAAAEAARRFNPVLSDRSLAAALARNVNRDLFGADVSAPYREVLAREGIASREQYDDLHRRAAELDALTGRLLEVPYTNSVPPALERIRDAGQTLALEYGRIWSKLADRLESRDQRIARLETEAQQFTLAMDSLARSTREGGYVLDPRDPQSILLYISRLHAPQVGDTVYVFRQEDELLATLRITAVGETVRASLVEPGTARKPIAAFDRILLAAAEEKKG